jgi:hypothetical protein
MLKAPANDPLADATEPPDDMADATALPAAVWPTAEDSHRLIPAVKMQSILISYQKDARTPASVQDHLEI